MTEIYKALYDYDTDKEDELSLKEGETVKITNKDSPDWWLAERLNNSKEYGLVPSNFIEKVVSSTKEEKKLAIVIRDYQAQDPEEISLQKDRIITVLDQHFAEGWWKGDSNGKIGVFPADHVEFVKDEDTEPTKQKKDPFKLAAYGVKQGGIGSILAGGFSLKRSSTTSNRQSVNDRPPSTNAPTANAPAIPTKPAVVNNTKPEASQTKGKKAMVIHEYVPENEDEIPLLKGEYVTIVDQLEDDGWWKGINENGATGVFPSNFVQILEHETPPPRPTRTRPATVNKIDDHRPPPVPVNTRPSSLLTNRPVTSPPPKPTTSPPVPTKRSNSIITPSHRRIPSIPLVSPDLPPVSPVQEASIALTRSTPKNNNDAIHHMAKPPKVNFNRPPSHNNNNETVMPTIPKRSPEQLNRPLSNNSETVPVIPKRATPPTEQLNRPISSNNSNSNDTVPTIPKRTPPTEHLPRPPSSNSETQQPIVPKRALPSAPVVEEDEDDEVTAMVRKLVHAEVEKIRKEFEHRLEDERIERLKIQVELEELKASLQ